MKLKEIIDKFEFLESNLSSFDIDIDGIAYDSRECQENYIFFAIKGLKFDGHEYIEKAKEKQAKVFVIDDEKYKSEEYSWILVENSRKSLSGFSNLYFDMPSAKMKIIGVTGTNGKTTTTNLIAEILKSKGKNVAVIGTLGVSYNGKDYPGNRTTPEALELHGMFKTMLEDKVEYVIMEVSSHALDLYRVEDIKFDAAVFTNLTQDHLDYHENMENYFLAKLKLFELVDANGGNMVVNADDLYGKRIIEMFEKAKSYSIVEDSDYRAENVHLHSRGVDFKLHDQGFMVPLNGKFNIYNSLAATIVCENEGISLTEIKDILNSFKNVPGRFQRIESKAKFEIIVDYAHTPDSLENIIRTAREFTKGQIITVFGCGGDRDASKRPIMGEIVAKYSDYPIITSDNPRTEDPDLIIKDIIPGVEKEIGDKEYKVEVDRRKAIEFALNIAKENDIILIAGKGHEDYQEINGVKHPFDDSLIAKEIVNELYK